MSGLSEVFVTKLLSHEVLALRFDLLISEQALILVNLLDHETIFFVSSFPSRTIMLFDAGFTIL